MPFYMLFQEKKNAFLRNTANKHRVINITRTELIKPGCNVFHPYYDAAIGTTKLSVQSFMKCLITEISETRIYLCCCCNTQAIIQNKK